MKSYFLIQGWKLMAIKFSLEDKLKQSSDYSTYFGVGYI